MSSDYESYSAVYCESCGTLHAASNHVEDIVEEPVHRLDILEALGDGDIREVAETVARELRDCEKCGGQVVDRYFAVGDIPEPDYDVSQLDDDDFEGRDPDEDALLFDGERHHEVNEIPGMEANSDDE